jgi:hypothetical protein
MIYHVFFHPAQLKNASHARQKGTVKTAENHA